MLSKLNISLGRRALHTGRVASQAADAASTQTPVVDPNNPIIAPTVIPWKQYKNEIYAKRGYTLADKDWTEWSDLPAPYKYLGVKVNPEHVEKKGFFWDLISDWRTAVPVAGLVAMPLYSTGMLPGFDERMELGLLIFLASTVLLKQVGPMYFEWRYNAVLPKVKALYKAEAELNATIADTINAYKNGRDIPETTRTINAIDRAIKHAEANAATNKIQQAHRDSLVAQLDYLVALKNQGSSAAANNSIKEARASIEKELAANASTQQKSIETAIAALTSGEGSINTFVAPLFSAAVEAAKSSPVAAAENPFKSAQQIEIFKKRFGYVEDVVSEATLERAKMDKGSYASLAGKVGKTPAVGDKYILKAPITYLK